MSRDLLPVELDGTEDNRPQTDIVIMDIATYRLNRPRGQFREQNPSAAIFKNGSSIIMGLPA